MSWADALASRLARLQNEGTIPGKALSTSMLARLRSLVEMRVIVEERSGAGVRWRVENREGLERFIRAHYPGGLTAKTKDGVVQAPIVFVSYSHDSAEHEADVLQ